MKPAHSQHHIVIIGGGAGGLELATQLGNLLGKNKQADITLIDSSLTHLWKPLLHEVAAGTLNSHEDELSYLAQANWHHFRFRLGRVDTVDREKKQVTTAATLDANNDEYIPRRTFDYDTLILAVGSVSNDFGINGIKQHCHFIDQQNQADYFHQHLLRSYYTAHTQNESMREGQLHIAIAGAGATGVELAAELYGSTRQLIEFGLDRIDADKHLKITIIEAAERILPGLPPHLSDKVSKELQGIGIDILTNERITQATTDGFETETGKFIPAGIKVWAAGIKAPDFLADITGLETNRINQLVVRRTLQTTHDDNIFAFGDCAACPMEGKDMNVPPRAQAAHQQASMLLKTMKMRLHNDNNLPVYTYMDYGSLINMSQYSTVGSLMGNIAKVWSKSIFIEGLFARFVYVSLYKMHQVALHGFIRTGLTTVANLLTRRNKPRMKLH
ncbi:MAG: NAD(P)/FAD-dependent oxidoreductase [Gammaproteobacteria bacterium]|jgi:NADH:ubiquinone reductase (H+-translocating)|nr:NAD(P)/FAD-dependent oxidoreductase [Gammaproteobacteria bacterium]